MNLAQEAEVSFCSEVYLLYDDYKINFHIYIKTDEFGLFKAAMSEASCVGPYSLNSIGWEPFSHFKSGEM